MNKNEWAFKNEHGHNCDVYHNVGHARFEEGAGITLMDGRVARMVELLIRELHSQNDTISHIKSDLAEMVAKHAQLSLLVARQRDAYDNQKRQCDARAEQWEAYEMPSLDDAMESGS